MSNANDNLIRNDDLVASTRKENRAQPPGQEIRVVVPSCHFCGSEIHGPALRETDGEYCCEGCVLKEQAFHELESARDDAYLALAESLGGGIPLLYIFLFNPLVGFALLLPISIGGLGVNQSAYVLFYGIVGVPENLALAVSLLMQLIIYLTSLPGGVLWWRSRSTTEPAASSSPPIPQRKPGETG